MTGTTRAISSATDGGCDPAAWRFATDVEQVGALPDHREPVIDGGGWVGVLPALGNESGVTLTIPHTSGAGIGQSA